MRWPARLALAVGVLVAAGALVVACARCPTCPPRQVVIVEHAPDGGGCLAGPPPPPRTIPRTYGTDGGPCPTPWEVCFEREGAAALSRRIEDLAEYADHAWLACGARDAGTD